MRLSVNYNYFVFVLKIVENLAQARVCRAEFGLAPERHRCDDFGVLHVDDCRRLAASVESVRFMRARVVKHPVGTLVRIQAGQRLQIRQIDYRRLAAASAGHDAARQIGCHRHAMHTRSVRDFANDFVAINIDDHYVASVADVESPSGFIDRHVIPAAVSCRRNLFDKAVEFIRQADPGRQRRRAE